MFLKVPVKIILRFGENNVLGPKDIDIYLFLRFAEGVTREPYFFSLLFIKTGKVQEHDLN